MGKDSVFLTILFDDDADRDRISQIAKKFSKIYMFKYSTGLYYSGDESHGNQLVSDLEKLGYKMTVLH